MSEIQINLTLDWDGEKPDTQTANAVQVQRFGENVVLSFGVALPPFALSGMSEEEITKYLEENDVPVRQVRRTVMPIPMAKEVVRLILANLPAPTATDEAQQQTGGAAESDQGAS